MQARVLLATCTEYIPLKKKLPIASTAVAHFFLYFLCDFSTYFYIYIQVFIFTLLLMLIFEFNVQLSVPSK